MRLSDATLKRKLRLDAILTALGDYRDAGWLPTTLEKALAAARIDDDMSPGDAAELIQQELGARGLV